MACATDPMDLHLAKHLHTTRHNHNNNNGYSAGMEEQKEGAATAAGKNASSKEEPQYREPPENEETKYCWVCETTVAEHAMHCKYCNKCVSHFDHHCQWLNTCVGEANYKYFYGTLWSITGVLTVHIGVMAGIVVDIFVDLESNRAEDWFSLNLSELVAGVNILFIIFDGIALFLILQLLFFHIMLQRKNLSTYKYILKDNEKKREQNKIKAMLQARRTVEIQRAKRANRSPWKLQMGGYARQLGCIVCDPLQESDIAVPTVDAAPSFEYDDQDDDDDVNYDHDQEATEEVSP